MEVKQIASMMNEVTNEILGKENLVAEDLNNIVDVGTEIFNANAVDAYVKSLVNHIGKVVFVNRIYTGGTPSVLMDGWEFGSILEKVTVTKLPEAVENESWKLEDGESYDPFVFHQPEVAAKFYNKKVTFEIEMSFAEMQVKQSFSSAEQLNGFISMIETSIQNSMTIKLDSLITRTINKAIADTMIDDFTTGGSLKQFSSGSGIKAVNLLYLYNTKMAALDSNWTNLTAVQAITNPGFIRFAAYTMGLYVDRLTKISTLFNIGGLERFTPSSDLHSIMLSEFRRAADVYLQSDTYHDEYTKLTQAEVVPYWQGPGTDYNFTNTSKIIYKTGENSQVEMTGVLGVMFDRNALGVANLNRRVTSSYNPKGEFYNNFYKADAGYFVDGNENVVVFFVA